MRLYLVQISGPPGCVYLTEQASLMSGLRQHTVVREEAARWPMHVALVEMEREVEFMRGEHGVHAWSVGLVEA